MADTRPLANPHFRRLWLANIVTVIGAQLTVVAVPAQIYADTGSSAYVGLTGVFGLVPLVVFGLWGGALADAMDRRTLLVITTIGLIGTSAPVLGAGGARQHATCGCCSGLFAVQQAFFAVNQPTRSAVLPKLLPPELLPAGELAEHDDLPGRRDRRPAGRRRADPGARLLVALPDRHDHAVRDAGRGGRGCRGCRSRACARRPGCAR